MKKMQQISQTSMAVSVGAGKKHTWNKNLHAHDTISSRLKRALAI